MAQGDAEEEKKQARLGLKDYLALSIAAIETFLLPLVVIAVVLILFALLLSAKL